MNNLVRSTRLLFGTAGLVAIIVQMQHGLRYNELVLSNFFSYFTIQSNILIVTILILGVFLSSSQFYSPRFQVIRGAITSYIMTTGIVYFLFLRGMEAELQTTIPWVNAVLHTILPLYALFDWVSSPSRRPISFRLSLIWTMYPILYLIYTLIRGHFIEWYPYPFLNPTLGGYNQVLISSIMITCLILLCSSIVVGSLSMQKGTFAARASK